MVIKHKGKLILVMDKFSNLTDEQKEAVRNHKGVMMTFPTEREAWEFIENLRGDDA